MEAQGLQTDELRRALSALGDAHRFRLAMLLVDLPLSVGTLVAATGWPQPLVSHHLAILRRAGLVEAQPVGRRRLYRLAEPETPTLRSLLALFRSSAASAAPPVLPAEPARERELAGPPLATLEDYLL